MRRKTNSQIDGPRCESMYAAIGMAAGCVLGGLLGRIVVVSGWTQAGLGTTLIVLAFAFAGAAIGQYACHYRSSRLAVR